jgi:hypothetical protein
MAKTWTKLADVERVQAVVDQRDDHEHLRKIA